MLKNTSLVFLSTVALVVATSLIIQNIHGLSMQETASIAQIANNISPWSMISSLALQIFNDPIADKRDMDMKNSAEIIPIQGSANPTKKVFTNFRHEYGFKFPNNYQTVATVISDESFPDFISKGDKTFTIQGRCGGMAYAALDYWYAHKKIPGYESIISPQGEALPPPNDTPISKYIFNRFYDSLDFPYSGVNKNVLNSLFKTLGGLLESVLPFRGIDDMEEVPKFVFYSWTKDNKWACKCLLGVCTPCIPGVRDLTNKDIPKVTSSIDKGKPVVLGVIGARTLSQLGTNHQVVVYGYEYFKKDRSYVFHIYDPNLPNINAEQLYYHDPTLPIKKPVLVWHQDFGYLQERVQRYSMTFENPPNVKTWRGFFVMDYTPKVPPEMFIDIDYDGVDDSQDNCDTKKNADQKDTNNNGVGDVCEFGDIDNDGITDSEDNCKYVANPDQKDDDNNGVGDACNNVIL